MKAWRLDDWKPDPVLVAVGRLQATSGEVLVRVGGSGACHSGLHLMHGFGPGVLPWGPPFTLGHEVAGWIEEVGGAETHCENLASAPVPGGGGRVGLDGGMAEFMLVPAVRHIVPLPEGLEPAAAAPLADAALLDAYRQLEQGAITGRAVVVPHTEGSRS